ncbi:hypothetical protein F8M41_025867 [Gigaspora margarita]|uniref:Uncharacterized protein n=1 Tax=Gigaspora margarita TaxID=4874 RepID=A0A8H4AAZ2_GIGMA|nr:hypothetical protein F8M41_025867 [Gigaspora margarita]
MSTNPTPQNVLYLKNLALNILKNGFPEVIAKAIYDTYLHSCIPPSCLEDYVKDLPQCSKCTIEVEPINYSETNLQENQTQSTLVTMQILPQMKSSQSRNTVTSDTTHSLNLPLLPFLSFSDYTKQSQKRLSEDTTKNKSSNLKSSTAEQNTNTITSYQVIATKADPQPIDFLNLYTKITSAESEIPKTKSESNYSIIYLRNSYSKTLEVSL